MIKVKLTLNELVVGSLVGARRRIDCIYRGNYREGWNKDPIGWNMDLEGALAEMAVAKAMNRYWDASVNTYKAPDVGKDQVRHTHKPDGKLIIRPGDKDHEVFWLVVGISPEFTVCGWMTARDAKVDKYAFNENYGGAPPCWMVPQEDLIPPERYL